MQVRDSRTARRAAGRPEELLANRRSWRRALFGLVSAAFRVHRYRELHSRMLRDALDAVDCNSPCGDAGDR